MNRRRHRIFRPRSGRPTEWERFAFAHATSFNTPAESVIASPISFEPNVVDSNWTLRGIRLTFSYRYSFAIVVPDDISLMGFALYRKGLNDPVVMDALAPASEDVLDMWQVQFDGTIAGSLIANDQAGSFERERKVKVMRKLDQGEAIFLAINATRFTVASSTTPQWGYFAQVSNLWARTGKAR